MCFSVFALNFWVESGRSWSGLVRSVDLCHDVLVLLSHSLCYLSLRQLVFSVFYAFFQILIIHVVAIAMQFAPPKRVDCDIPG